MFTSLKKYGFTLPLVHEKTAPEDLIKNSVISGEKGVIAYFCHEYAIHDSLHLYAGGLGILAGDIVLQAAEENIPLVALGLFVKRGLPTYPVKERRDNDPAEAGFSAVLDSKGEPLLLSVKIENRDVYARAWCKKWGSASLYLLDTDVEKNSAEDRRITEYLYPDGTEKKLIQDFAFGILSIKLLSALSITPSRYHLNEAHSCFVALGVALEEIEKENGNLSLKSAMQKIKPSIVGTKHTILPNAGLYLTREHFGRFLAGHLKLSGVSVDDLFSLGVEDANMEIFSTARFFARSVLRVNAVSKIHARFEKETFPLNDELIPITNGVNARRWTAPNLYKEFSPQEQLWKIHNEEKRELLQSIKEKQGVDLNPDALLISWARRFTTYKRPLLLFSDIERLIKILTNPQKPVIIVVSGQAYAGDPDGIALLEKMLQTIKDPRLSAHVAYIPDYSIPVDRELIHGSDLWLNTPLKGQEACGTSGMKAALNGVLQFSVADGWFDEVKDKDFLWVLGDENPEEELYRTLEEKIIPDFFNRDKKGLPLGWIQKMEKTRELVLQNYSTKRMLSDYISKLYFPS